MGWTTQVANAWRGLLSKPVRPRAGQMLHPLPIVRWQDYPADGLTPERLVNILRSADEGAVDQAMALFQQMEEKDAHLHSVAQTRRLALTSLRWRIVSAAHVQEGVDAGAADEAADYARAVLAGLESFEEVLQHLALAVGRNIALAETIWEVERGELRPVDLAAVPFDRLTFDEQGQVRVLTAEEPIRGVELPAGKFIVHTPHAVSGHPMRGGLLRVSALAYLGKHYALKDWMIFAEVFGMPIRVARYDTSATPEEKKELLRMLQSLGTDSAAIFSKAVELQLVEAGQGKAPPPYQGMCDFFNRELSKAWLGQTLTVETVGQTGTFSTAALHNDIRLDLRQDDIRKEGRTLRRDLLAPLTQLKFGPDVPVPFFERVYDPPRDLRELADVLRTATQELHLRVPRGWAHTALGIPAAEATEPAIGEP